MRRGRLRQQSTSRVVLAALLLTGLLAMHGASPPVAVGCVTGTGPITPDVPAMGAGHAMAGDPGLSDTRGSRAAVSAMVPSGDSRHGGTCVATLPRSPLTTMLASALALLAVVGFGRTGPLDAPGRRRRRPTRAPPWGAALLIRLGISRT
jgi:hypothetical protein